MKSITFLVTLLLISLNTNAGGLCFLQKCIQDANQKLLTCKDPTGGEISFRLNGTTAWAARNESTATDWQVTYSKCFSDGSAPLYEGTNTLTYHPLYPGWNTSVKRGEWSSGKAYITIGGKKTFNICSWRWTYLNPGWYPANYADRYRCGDQTYSFSLSDVDPNLSQEFEKARLDAKKMLEEAEKFYDEINIEITILNDVFDSIVGVDFDNISAEDLARVEQALALYNNLKETLDALRAKIEVETKNFVDYMDELEGIVDEVLENEGISPEDYEVDHPLVIPEIEIPVVVDDYTYYSENNFYTDYADTVLSELETAVSHDDRIVILEIVKAWLVTTERLKRNLQSQTYQSPAEWDAFMLSFREVDRLIFGDDNTNPILDRDLWFSDSPVKLDEREAIKEIKNHYRGEGTIIENELKTWREEDLTDEQRRMLESFKALGHVVKATTNASQETIESVGRIVAGAAIAVKEGLKCIAIATVAGDFGDFFEVTTGINICTGEYLSNSERVLSALGLIVGNGATWRAVGNAVGLLSSTRHVANISASIIEKANKIGITTKKDLKELSELVNSRYICPVGS
jgi:Pre-toxin TG